MNKLVGEIKTLGQSDICKIGVVTTPISRQQFIITAHRNGNLQIWDINALVWAP